MKKVLASIFHMHQEDFRVKPKYEVDEVDHNGPLKVQYTAEKTSKGHKVAIYFFTLFY